MKKFTFKIEKPTGKYRSFYPYYHIIKYDKKECGHISDEPPFTISLMVMKTEQITDNNTNCKWRWIYLKKESKTLQEAKDFLNKNIKYLLTKYTLNLLEY